jgi:hypothetical protein
MSAFVVIFTREGFSIAADGKLSADESTVITEAIAARLAESVEKIYVGPDNKLGYFLTGFVEDDVTGFDLTQAVRESLSSIPSDSFSHYFEYIRRVALKFKSLVVDAQSRGLRFPEWPEFTEDDTSFATEVGFAGYFKGLPFSAHFKLTHVRQSNLALRISPINGLGVGYKYESVPFALPRLALDGDPRFAEYKDALLRPFKESLEDAAEYSKGLIALCSDPMAAAVDPICKGIGGHIHIADVTPDGFRWRIPPKERVLATGS